mgnify:CR=1 FL=1
MLQLSLDLCEHIGELIETLAFSTIGRLIKLIHSAHERASNKNTFRTNAIKAAEIDQKNKIQTSSKAFSLDLSVTFNALISACASVSSRSFSANQKENACQVHMRIHRNEKEEDTDTKRKLEAEPYAPLTSFSSLVNSILSGSEPGRKLNISSASAFCLMEAFRLNLGSDLGIGKVP